MKGIRVVCTIVESVGYNTGVYDIKIYKEFTVYNTFYTYIYIYFFFKIL